MAYFVSKVVEGALSPGESAEDVVTAVVAAGSAKEVSEAVEKVRKHHAPS